MAGVLPACLVLYVNVIFDRASRISRRPGKCPGTGRMSTQATGARRQYTISQLASEFGTTARTLRFYEDKGLLAPARRGQNRIYNARDRVRLKLILQGKRIGLPLNEIKDVLELYELRGGEPEQLRANLARLREQIAMLDARRRDIDQAIGDLGTTCALIEDLLKAH